MSEDKFRKKFSVFRVAFRKYIMFGKNFALVFIEILPLLTENELEVNETEHKSLKIGVPCLTSRRKCFNAILVKTFHQEVEKKRRISKNRALVWFRRAVEMFISLTSVYQHAIGVCMRFSIKK